MSHLSRFLSLGAGSLVLFILTGCDTMRPLSSKPPRARITLPATVSSSWWAGVLPPIKYTVMLPPGEYRPLYEDDQYYYYQAPAKIIYRGALDFGSSFYDGGMYVARGTTIPRGWYYIGEDGTQSFGRFDTPPPIR